MIRIAICDDEIEIVTELSFKIDNIMKSIGEEAKYISLQIAIKC